MSRIRQLATVIAVAVVAATVAVAGSMAAVGSGPTPSGLQPCKPGFDYLAHRDQCRPSALH